MEAMWHGLQRGVGNVALPTLRRPPRSRTMGYVAEPVTKATTLVTADGVPINTVHLARDSDLAIVLVHGFTLSWQRPAVWRIPTRLNRMAGVLAFDLRGHGSSGGLSTMGDKEINDLDVVVAYA